MSTKLMPRKLAHLVSNQTADQRIQQTAFDVILIGAGLANGLLAFRLQQLNPQKKILILEKQSKPTEPKTWSCHESDLEGFPWAQELMSASWNGYEIKFPKLRRSFQSAYHTLHPRHLQMKLGTLANVQVLYDHEVLHSDGSNVTLASQAQFKARCVIDSTCSLDWKKSQCGFQKFVGLHVELSEEHGLRSPILMDATVPQTDGFRFFYVLPLGPKELLIEDTCFSESPDLNVDLYLNEIQKYASSQNWKIIRQIQFEKGVLPLPLNANLKSSLADHSNCALNGMGAGFFHPVTGYSLPDAVRLAERLSRIPDLTTESAKQELLSYQLQNQSQKDFLFFLNRMMFKASLPEHRYRILERFYKLPESLIQRFYKGQMSAADRVRVLIGRPPVPVHKALKCILPGGLS